jgi:hypothetical protein
MIARVTINGSVYPTSSGGSPISTLTTRSDGTIPGWIDPGTYTLSVDGGTTRTVEAVSGTGSGGGTSITIQDEGNALTVRPNLNFIGSPVTAADNPGSNRTDVTISAGGGITVQDEGSALTSRAVVNVKGSEVTAADNSGAARTDLTFVALQSRLFSQPGNAVVGVSGSWRADRSGTIIRCNMSVLSAPSGSSLIVEVRKNGTTFTTLTIASGSSTDVTSAPATTFVAGDKLSVNATSVGSTAAATGVVVQLDYSLA